MLHQRTMFEFNWHSIGTANQDHDRFHSLIDSKLRYPSKLGFIKKNDTCVDIDDVMTTTTTAATTYSFNQTVSNVLVLFSLFKEWKDAILIDSNGDDKIASCIITGTGTSAFKACSVTWKNNFYIIGGANSDGRSIVKLSGRVINRIGDRL